MSKLRKLFESKLQEARDFTYVIEQVNKNITNLKESLKKCGLKKVFSSSLMLLSNLTFYLLILALAFFLGLALWQCIITI